MRSISLVLTFSCFAFAVINVFVPRAETVAKQDVTQPMIQQMLLASR